MKTSHWSAIFLFSAIFCGIQREAFSAAQAENLKAEVQELMEKARDLKAEGRNEESERVARQAKVLERNARPFGESRQPRQAPERRRASANRLRARLAELESAGRQEEAQSLRERLEMIEREADREAERARSDEEWRQEQLERTVEPKMAPPRFREERAPFPAREELPVENRRQRLHHVEQAIEHLHAAGLHEPADQIAREAARWRNEFERMPEFHGPPVPPEARNIIRRLEGEMDELRRELRDLRQALDDMRALFDRQ
jgi:hypothetical protein